MAVLLSYIYILLAVFGTTQKLMPLWYYIVVPIVIALLIFGVYYLIEKKKIKK